MQVRSRHFIPSFLPPHLLRLISRQNSLSPLIWVFPTDHNPPKNGAQLGQFRAMTLKAASREWLRILLITLSKEFLLRFSHRNVL